jgi:hypothetical protein
LQPVVGWQKPGGGPPEELDDIVTPVWQQQSPGLKHCVFIVHEAPPLEELEAELLPVAEDEAEFGMQLGGEQKKPDAQSAFVTQDVLHIVEVAQL